jgi:hypothetical protein
VKQDNHPDRVGMLRYDKSGAAIDAALARVRSNAFMKLPFDPIGREYYRAVQGPGFREHSFALGSEKNIIAIVECDGMGGVLGRFGFPIEPWIDPVLPFDLRRQSIADIFAELRRIVIENKLSAIRLRSSAGVDPDGLLLGRTMQLGAQPTLEVRSVVDLAQSEEALFDCLRKGHRQQVRWGNGNLVLSFVDGADPDAGKFDAYRLFHAEIAGRTTRSATSWDVMYRAIAAGRGDLVLGHLHGKLVSGTLVLDGLDTAYYASGVYDRTQFDKPLGHAPLFAAMVRAKRRGLRMFDVGEVPFPGSGASEKEIAIGHFKRGFGAQAASSVILTWDPQAVERAG